MFQQPEDDNEVFSGWLTKRGGRRKNWRRRWFVLSSDFIIRYYEDDSLLKPKGSVDLKEATNVAVNPSPEIAAPTDYTFDITTPQRVWYMAAENNAQMLKWVQVIRAALFEITSIRENARRNYERGNDCDDDEHIVYSGDEFGWELQVGDDENNYRPFTEETSKEIERGYRQRMSHVQLTRGYYSQHPEYIVDFRKEPMQVNTKNGEQRKLRRVTIAEGSKTHVSTPDGKIYVGTLRRKKERKEEEKVDDMKDSPFRVRDYSVSVVASPRSGTFSPPKSPKMNRVRPVCLTTNILENATNDPRIGEALRKNVCTLKITGEVYVTQNVYECITCELRSGKGLCEICRDVCHKNHEVVFSERTPFYCDCGLQGKCRAFPREIRLVNGVDYKLLFNACFGGDINMVRSLTVQRADVNAADEGGVTPLMFACRNGHLDIMDVLIQHAACIEVTAKKGVTAMMLAAGQGHSDVIEKLIENGACVNHAIQTSPMPMGLFGMFGSGTSAMNVGLTALITACKSGEIRVLDTLLRLKADVNYCHESGISALMMACRSGHLNIAELLINRRASVNISNGMGTTALMDATKFGHHLIVRKLISERARVNAHDSHFGHTPLILSVSSNRIDLVTFLIEHGADVNLETHDGNSPLMLSVHTDNMEIISALLRQNASVDSVNQMGATALLIAAQQGRKGCVEKFIDHKADVNYAAPNGDSPLIVSAMAGHLDIAKLLVERNADVNHLDKKGETAIDLAGEFGNEQIANYLKVSFGQYQAIFLESEISNISRLPNGHFGKTYRGTVSLPGVSLEVVCKVPVSKFQHNQWHELNVLKNLPSHPLVLDLLGVCLDFRNDNNNAQAYVIPYQHGGSLRDYVISHADIPLEELLSICLEMIEGVAHVHKSGYIHRDLAIRNFLLSDLGPDKHCILSDFGIALKSKEVVPTTDSKTDDIFQLEEDRDIYITKNGCIIPWRYSAPESLVHHQFNVRSDMWMLGVAFWELFIGAYQDKEVDIPHPFVDSVTRPHTLIQKLSGSRPISLHFPDSIPRFIKDLVAICCSIEPSNRPNIRHLIQDFKNFLTTNTRSNSSTSNVSLSTPLEELKEPPKPDPMDEVRLNELLEMIAIGDLEEVRKITSQGFDVNTKAKKLWTALLEASTHGHKDIVKHLLDVGADPDHVDTYGYSALSLAAKERHKDVFTMLVDHNANVHNTQYPDATSLLRAVGWEGDHDGRMVEFLLENGISPNAIVTQTGMTVIDSLTANNVHPALIQPLKLAKSVPFKSAVTMLIFAAYKGHADIVELLVSYGVDVERKDAYGITAMEYALKQNHKDIVEILKTPRHVPYQTKFFAVDELFYIADISDGKQLFSASFNSTSGISLKVLCKVFSAQILSAQDLREVSVLTRLPQHGSITPLLGICMDFQDSSLDFPRPALVLEHRNKTLRSYLFERGRPELDDFLNYALQMTNGIIHLHQHNYVHNDITLKHFLVSDVSNDNLDGMQQIVLSEFRSTCYLSDTSKTLHQDAKSSLDSSQIHVARLPFRWCAPETLQSAGQILTKQSDIWMLGVTFWEMLLQSAPPYQHADISHPGLLFKYIKKMTDTNGIIPLEFPANAPEAWEELVFKCCKYEPSERLTAKELKREIQSVVGTIQSRQQQNQFSFSFSSSSHLPVDMLKTPSPRAVKSKSRIVFLDQYDDYINVNKLIHQTKSREQKSDPPEEKYNGTKTEMKDSKLFSDELDGHNLQTS